MILLLTKPTRFKFTLIVFAFGFLATASKAALAPATLGVAELTLSALEQHPSLRASSARQEAAKSKVEAARWQFWPTPSVGVERLQSDPSETRQGDKTVGVVRIQQPLWTGGRLTSNLQRAESEVLLAQAETEAARELLANRVIQAWSEAVVAIRKINAQQLSLQSHERLLKMVERRLSEGASAVADVDLARSRIEVLTSEIMLLTAQRDSALDKLKLLIGRSFTEQEVVLSHQPTQVRTASLGSLIEMAQAVSPQLRKAQHSVEVASADVGVAKASLMPEVSVRFEHQQGNLYAASPPSSNQVFISLNSSFGAGLSSFSGVNAAIAQLNAAQEEMNLQKQALIEQVQTDFTLVQAAQARLKGLMAASKASANVLESYERQFLAGRKQWLDLMNAAREQAQSEAQLADAKGALELSSLRLVLWSGGVDALLNVRPQAQALKETQ